MFACVLFSLTKTFPPNQGEDGEAGDPGPVGEPGIPVSHIGFMSLAWVIQLHASTL